MLIALCHLSIYLAYGICDRIYPDADRFDLLRHVFYYFTIFMGVKVSDYAPDEKYEKHVIFLKTVLIYGTLFNCALYNIIGAVYGDRVADRSFNWYSFAFVILSSIRGCRKGYPDFYERNVTWLIGRKSYDFLHSIKTEKK